MRYFFYSAKCTYDGGSLELTGSLCVNHFPSKTSLNEEIKKIIYASCPHVNNISDPVILMWNELTEREYKCWNYKEETK